MMLMCVQLLLVVMFVNVASCKSEVIDIIKEFGVYKAVEGFDVFVCFMFTEVMFGYFCFKHGLTNEPCRLES